MTPIRRAEFQRETYVRKVDYLFDGAKKPPLPTKAEIHAHCAGCASARKKIRGLEVMLSCRTYNACKPGCIDKH